MQDHWRGKDRQYENRDDKGTGEETRAADPHEHDSLHGQADRSKRQARADQGSAENKLVDDQRRGTQEPGAAERDQRVMNVRRSRQGRGHRERESTLTNVPSRSVRIQTDEACSKEYCRSTTERPPRFLGMPLWNAVAHANRLPDCWSSSQTVTLIPVSSGGTSFRDLKRDPRTRDIPIVIVAL